MHDAIIGERLGLPSAGIMTDKFISAAELMACVLGAEGYPFVSIAHPISSAGEAVLVEQARIAAARARDIILGADA